MCNVIVYQERLSPVTLQIKSDFYKLMLSYLLNDDKSDIEIDVVEFGLESEITSEIKEIIAELKGVTLFDIRGLKRIDPKKSIVNIINDNFDHLAYILVDNVYSFNPDFLTSKKCTVIDIYGNHNVGNQISKLQRITDYYFVLIEELKQIVSYKIITNLTHCKKKPADSNSYCIISSINIEHCLTDISMLVYYYLEIENSYDVVLYPSETSPIFLTLVDTLSSIRNMYSNNNNIKLISDNSIINGHSSLKVLVFTDLIDTADTLNQAVENFAEINKGINIDFSRTISLFSSCDKTDYIYDDKLEVIFSAKVFKYSADDCQLCKLNYPFALDRYSIYSFNSFFFWWLHRNYSQNKVEQYYNHNRNPLKFCPDFTNWFKSIGPFFAFHLENVLTNLNSHSSDNLLFIYPIEDKDIEKKSVSATMAISLFYLNDYESIGVTRELLNIVEKHNDLNEIEQNIEYQYLKSLLSKYSRRKIVIIDESILEGGTMNSLLSLLTLYGKTPILVYVFTCFNPSYYQKLRDEYKDTMFESSYEFLHKEV